MTSPGKITIRDGRTGGAAAQATSDGAGAVLGVIEQAELLDLDIGDKIKLADGTDAFVIRTEEKLGPDSWEQIIYVGNFGDWKSPLKNSAD